MTEFIDLEREVEPRDQSPAGDDPGYRSTAVVVAGMHRSGTSALVRVLSLLGLDLPRTLYPARTDNPLGYWEPLPVVEAHEEFLAAVGSSFDDFSAVGEGALHGSAARALENRLVDILEHEYGSSALFVVKDPRICRLVPIWRAALVRFGAAPRFVLPVRNPLEVAASLKLRNEYATTKSLLLWLRHVLEAERHTRGFRRSVVSYEELLRDWQGVAGKMAHELAILWPRTSHASHAEIEQFLSPRRRHHSFELDELEARQDVVDWVKTTYAILAAAADGGALEEDVLDAIRGELDRADSAFGPLLAELSLTQRTQGKVLSERAIELSEQATELAAARTLADSRAQDLDDRTRELADVRADVERLTAELMQREETLAAAAAETAASRQQAEQLQAEHAHQEQALVEATADVERLIAELTQREETLAIAAAETAASRQQADRLQAQLAERERGLGEAKAEVERLATEGARREKERAEAETSLRRLERRVRTLVEEAAAQDARARRAHDDVATLRTALATRGERLTTVRAALADAQRQRRQLSRELARRAETLSAVEAENERLRFEGDALRATAAARDSRASLLEAEKAELGTAIAALEREAERTVEELGRRDEETRRKAALVEDMRKTLASYERSETSARNELREVSAKLDEARAALGPAYGEIGRLSHELAVRDASLAQLQSRRFHLRLRRRPAPPLAPRVRPRTNLRALSQFASWLTRPHRGGWRLIREYRQLRRSGTFAAAAYLAANPDVRASGLDPLMHYIEHGIREGRTLAPVRDGGAKREPPSTLSVRRRTRLRALSQFASWLRRPHRGGWRFMREYVRLRRVGSFRADVYLAANPDVDASGLEPLMHYVEHGIREGRAFVHEPAIANHLGEPEDATASMPPKTTPVLRPPRPAASSGVALRSRAPSLPSEPLPPADCSDFVVLLSRQRSGTNALRSILGTHPDVFCFNEVFNLPDRDSEEPFLRESNFFTFLERYAGGDIRLSLPDNHERLFLDFLDYLRCLTEKRYAVIDVKYNTTHFLARPWLQHGTPYLFELVARHGLHVLNITRKNYLRYVLSVKKASGSAVFTVDHNQEEYVDRPHRLDPESALRQISYCGEEDELICRYLADHSRRLVFDYADLFPGDGTVIAPEFLAQFSEWRGISNQFVLDPEYRKQSSLPLHQAIENYDEIATALRNTPFAYCLEDEPAYRVAGNAPPPVAEPTGSQHLTGNAKGDAGRRDWATVLGSDPREFSRELYRHRPAWIKGSLSLDDACFLFEQVLARDGDRIVEVGTASGFSTAVLAHGLMLKASAGCLTADWRVQSYDASETVYFDVTRRVGDAAREMLPDAVLRHVEFNAPATALDAGRRRAPESIDLLFLDANHKHPWPALDLLALLEGLCVGGAVALHDVNLPRIHEQHSAWGVAHVFEELGVEMLVPDVALPNIAAFVVPDDKATLAQSLLAIVDAHAWEAGVPESFVRSVRERVAGLGIPARGI